MADCHADHLSSAQQLRKALDVADLKVGIGAKIVQVQTTFKSLFFLEHLATDGSQFDVLLSEGSEVKFGGSTLRVFETPGHTVDSISFELVGQGALFVGDTIFAPDKGSARCDFPGGDAAALKHSIDRILSYPPETKIYLCRELSSLVFLSGFFQPKQNNNNKN